MLQRRHLGLAEGGFRPQEALARINPPPPRSGIMHCWMRRRWRRRADCRYDLVLDCTATSPSQPVNVGCFSAQTPRSLRSGDPWRANQPTTRRRMATLLPLPLLPEPSVSAKMPLLRRRVIAPLVGTIGSLSRRIGDWLLSGYSPCRRKIVIYDTDLPVSSRNEADAAPAVRGMRLALTQRRESLPVV